MADILSRLTAEQLAELAAHVAATYPEAAAPAAADEHKRAELTRTTTEKGARMTGPQKIGGDFTPTPNPPFIAERLAIYDTLKAAFDEKIAVQPREPIVVTLPSGEKIDGTSFETSPLKIAEDISRALAQRKVVAKVKYTSRVGTAFEAIAVGMDDAEVNDEELEAGEEAKDESWVLWDMNRPLEGSCNLELLGFDHPEGKMVFWHSSAHVLGGALELEVGAKLTVGPPLQDRFYYDSYLGDMVLDPAILKKVGAKAKKLCKADAKFERIIITKEEALTLFAENPFKLELIRNKIPAGSSTSVYRSGDFVDLCPGPHIPRTKMVKALEMIDSSSCYWGGHADGDVLQRCYAISFPEKKEMKSWQEMMKAAELRDHRKVGHDSELFFRHNLSPGSAFFLPAGAHMYNRLIKFIRTQYRKRGYMEVVTPNLFNCKLWKTSGHYQVRACVAGVGARGVSARARGRAATEDGRHERSAFVCLLTPPPPPLCTRTHTTSPCLLSPYEQHFVNSGLPPPYKFVPAALQG